MRAIAAAVLALAVGLGTGACSWLEAWREPPGPAADAPAARPDVPQEEGSAFERGAALLDREAWEEAEARLREATALCDDPAEGRVALLLLGTLHLDPRNPGAVPDTAALMALRHLRLQGAPPSERLLAEGLYALALGRRPRGAPPGVEEDPAPPADTAADSGAEPDPVEPDTAAADPPDPGPSDPEPSDPGPSDPGPSDPGPSEADSAATAGAAVGRVLPAGPRLSGCPLRADADSLRLPTLDEESWRRSPAGVEGRLRERAGALEERIEELEAELRRIRRLLGGTDEGSGGDGPDPARPSDPPGRSGSR